MTVKCLATHLFSVYEPAVRLSSVCYCVTAITVSDFPEQSGPAGPVVNLNSLVTSSLIENADLSALLFYIGDIINIEIDIISFATDLIARVGGDIVVPLALLALLHLTRLLSWRYRSFKMKTNIEYDSANDDGRCCRRTNELVVRVFVDTTTFNCDEMANGMRLSESKKKRKETGKEGVMEVRSRREINEHVRPNSAGDCRTPTVAPQK
ncbi:hypothetical protein OUZ56_009299 [Daphnia magna]|uniref:Uncharacterized protein n=1 Tax=Daphnia magna TaxID=35525 RepID=A0ABR0AFM6_9CRUS|nr:hypothetical protein OUZ56_009299 [Daphnia magna]